MAPTDTFFKLAAVQYHSHVSEKKKSIDLNRLKMRNLQKIWENESFRARWSGEFGLFTSLCMCERNKSHSLKFKLRKLHGNNEKPLTVLTHAFHQLALMAAEWESWICVKIPLVHLAELQ